MKTASLVVELVHCLKPTAQNFSHQNRGEILTIVPTGSYKIEPWSIQIAIFD